MDERVHAVGGAALVRVGAETRRPEYGLVFCELPPRETGARRPARSAPVARAEAIPPGTSDGGGTETEGRRGGGGPLPYVSADPAREHLDALGRAGVGLKTVARLSGVSHGSLSKIVYGEPLKGRPPSRRIRPETLHSILAVSASQAGGGQRVDAAPTWTLVEELVAAGYSRAFLARALGSEAASPRLQIGKKLVRASTARAMEELHRRLISRPPAAGGQP